MRNTHVKQGFVLPVLSFFHGVVQDLDHALVRHFVGTFF